MIRDGGGCGDIVLLGDRSDALLDSVQKCGQMIGRRVHRFDAADFVQHLTIAGHIRGPRVNVLWSTGRHILRPERTSGLLNRLQYVTDSALETVDDIDRAYVREEYSAYLRFALTQFPNIINKPFGGSLVGYCRSLPYQWTFVERQFPDLSIPIWSFCRGEDLSEYLSESPNLIESTDPYDTHHWSANGRPQTDEWRLFYLRPRGNPVVITVLDDELWWRCSDGFDELSSESAGAMRRVVETCRRQYSLRLATFLVFIENGDSVTFGSCSGITNLSHLPGDGIEDFVNRLTHRLATPGRR